MKREYNDSFEYAEEMRVGVMERDPPPPMSLVSTCMSDVLGRSSYAEIYDILSKTDTKALELIGFATSRLSKERAVVRRFALFIDVDDYRNLSLPADIVEKMSDDILLHDLSCITLEQREILASCVINNMTVRFTNEENGGGANKTLGHYYYGFTKIAIEEVAVPVGWGIHIKRSCYFDPPNYGFRKEKEWILLKKNGERRECRPLVNRPV